MNNNETILVEIASYCDPDLLNTVHSALIQADNPHRIHFAICYQSDDLEIYNKLQHIRNCKVHYLKEEDAKGSCYARYLCQQMIEDEKYVFQIDAHMRFVRHWDTKIIRQLLSLNDPKAILSVYPPSTTDEMLAKNFDDTFFDKVPEGGVMYLNGFHDLDNYFVKINSIPIDKDYPKAYHRNVIISAGNFFTFSEAHKEVLHDPEMYFYGDEFPMAIRLFTYGWNVYSPGESFVYHQYGRKNQKFPSVKNAMFYEHRRLKNLIGIENDIDLGEFGLGKERSIEEFQKYSGIDFVNHKIHNNAELGVYDDPALKKKMSYFQQKQFEKRQKLLKNDLIEVLIVDPFGEYSECIDSCLRHAHSKDRISFIVGTTSSNKITDEEKKNKSIKEIVYFNEEDSYSKILSEISEYVGNSYILLVDSSVRFLADWDNCLCSNIANCGEKSALTWWVWLASKDTDIETFEPYTNVIKEFDCFYNYIASLKYNESINISKVRTPYPTPFISDGFLFMKADFLKKIPIDPNLTYDEFKYLYSIRLWTHGIQLYYSMSSHAVRTKEETELNKGDSHYDALSALAGINNWYAKSFPAKYKYDIGKDRTIAEWYSYIGVDYDPINGEIIEKK